MKTPPIFSSKRGYSLTELVMVVAIIGLVSLVAIPNVIGRLPEKRLRRAAWQICSDLRQARMQAVSENTNVEVRFNNTRDEYTIWVDSDKDGEKDDNEETVKSVNNIPDVDLYTHPTIGTFKPRGDFDSEYYYWFIRVYNPQAGYKYIYVFPNGHIDPYNL